MSGQQERAERQREELSASASPPSRFVLGLDVGSTVIRCHVYDQTARVRGSSAQKVENVYPQPGWVEIDPDSLWAQFVAVIKDAVKAAGVQMNQIVGLGISTQRATFITWNKKTGHHFHNFISWQDLRAAELVKSWNNSLIMKLLHGATRVLHFFSRSKVMLTVSRFNFSTQHATLRLTWILQNLSEVKRAVEEDNCCFGTIDTWLLYKLTKGSSYATDYSNASTTGFFDPYAMRWSRLITTMVSIPLSILPPVKDTSYNFGSVDEKIFGVPIPVVALVGDQQSAMFGECCFETGDVKLTMGTGTFLDINTGKNLQHVNGGFYPLIGWKIGQELVCLAEGNAGDTGTAIMWAQKLGRTQQTGIFCGKSFIAYIFRSKRARALLLTSSGAREQERKRARALLLTSLGARAQERKSATARARAQELYCLHLQEQEARARARALLLTSLGARAQERKRARVQEQEREWQNPVPFNENYSPPRTCHSLIGCSPSAELSSRGRQSTWGGELPLAHAQIICLPLRTQDVSAILQP